jgi:hypothetical protein
MNTELARFQDDFIQALDAARDRAGPPARTGDAAAGRRFPPHVRRASLRRPSLHSSLTQEPPVNPVLSTTHAADSAPAGPRGLWNDLASQLTRPTHLSWAGLLLYLLGRSAGALSLDRLLRIR